LLRLREGELAPGQTSTEPILLAVLLSLCSCRRDRLPTPCPCPACRTRPSSPSPGDTAATSPLSPVYPFLLPPLPVPQQAQLLIQNPFKYIFKGAPLLLRSERLLLARFAVAEIITFSHTV